jgi:hypothetical protein
MAPAVTSNSFWCCGDDLIDPKSLFRSLFVSPEVESLEHGGDGGVSGPERGGREDPAAPVPSAVAEGVGRSGDRGGLFAPGSAMRSQRGAGDGADSGLRDAASRRRMLRIPASERAGSPQNRVERHLPISAARNTACQTTTRRPRCLTNGSKSRSLCSSVYPLSMHRVAITVSMVLRTVTPRLRSARKFFAA